MYLSRSDENGDLGDEAPIRSPGSSNARSWAEVAISGCGIHPNTQKYTSHGSTNLPFITDVSSAQPGTDENEVDAFRNIPNLSSPTLTHAPTNDVWLHFEDHVASYPSKFFKTRMQRERHLCGVGIHVLSLSQARPDLGALRAKYWKKYWMAQKRYNPTMANSLQHKSPAQLTTLHLESIAASLECEELPLAPIDDSSLTDRSILYDLPALQDAISKVADVMHEHASSKEKRQWTLRRWQTLRPKQVCVRMWHAAYHMFRSSHLYAENNNNNPEHAKYSFKIGTLENSTGCEKITDTYSASPFQKAIPVYAQFERTSTEPRDIALSVNAARLDQIRRARAWCMKYKRNVTRSRAWILHAAYSLQLRADEAVFIYNKIMEKTVLVEVGESSNYYRVDRRVRIPSRVALVDKSRVREYPNPKFLQMFMGSMNHTKIPKHDVNDRQRSPSKTDKAKLRHLFDVRQRKLSKLRRHDGSSKHAEYWQFTFDVDDDFIIVSD